MFALRVHVQRKNIIMSYEDVVKYSVMAGYFLPALNCVLETKVLYK